MSKTKKFTDEDRRAITALLERCGSSWNSFNALRPDCYEHALARHSLEHLELLYSLLNTPGLTLEEISEQVPPWPKGTKRAGQQPGVTSLSQIGERLRTEATLNDLGQVSNFLDRFVKHAKTLPGGNNTKVLNGLVTMVGQEMIAAKMRGMPVSAQLKPLDRLLDAESAKAKMDLEWEKLKQREEALKLDREKFVSTTRTKIEAGLAELAQHIKGNEEAHAAFEAFKKAVKDLK